jgi:peptidoglycan hydrolase CwlO-like protein
MFPIVVSCAAILITQIISNKNMKYKINKDNEAKLDKKADVTLVESNKIEVEKDISDIRDSIEKNSNQHGILFKEINAANKGIARIEGYLKAKNEGK